MSKFSKLKNLKGVQIITIEPNNKKETFNHILHDIGKKHRIVLVSLSEPCSSILSNSKASNMLVIDCRGDQKKSSKNCVSIQSPRSLTEMSIEITKSLNSGKYNFFLFDSITTLLMYNDSETVQKFTHFLTSKLKAFQISGLMLSIDEEKSNKIIPAISQFFDRSVKL